jgi:hypothetical protein
VTGSLRNAFLVLAGAVAMMMLIVSANVASLQLARSVMRQKEMAIRAAIGAGRRRLIRQLLTENVVLSLCGGLLGLILAIGGTRLLTGLRAFDIPLLSTVRMDVASLVFSVLLAALTGLLFGFVPALQVPSISVHDSLKDTSRASTGSKRHTWIHRGLVVSEIALACVLLVGAGLLARSFLKVLEQNLGFQPERVAALRIDPSNSYSSRVQRNTYFNEVLARTRSLPGISSAGLTECCRSLEIGAGMSPRRVRFTREDISRKATSVLSATAISLQWEFPYALVANFRSKTRRRASLWL